MKQTEINEIEDLLRGKNRRKKSTAVLKGAIQKLFALTALIFSRCFEIVIALMVLGTVGLMVFIFLIFRKILKGKAIFEKVSIIGRKGRRINIFYFNCENYFLKNISLFVYVITNKLSIVGISIKAYDNVARVVGDSYLFNNKPGIFNLWYIRESARVTFDGQFGTEWEYAFKKSIIADILIILKSIPAMFYYFDATKCNPKVNLFNLSFDNLTMTDAIGKLAKTIEDKDKKKVYFVNPDCLNKIFTDKEYFDVLNCGDYIFPDGIGVNIACKLLKDPLLENINGTDMLPFICELADKQSYSMYLLGGKPGVAEKMKINLQSKYNNLQIVGVQDGYFDKDKDNNSVVEKINESKADILLVAFGAPIQEKWIEANNHRLNAKVQMGVGGLFDFFSGGNKRAPKWMREVGLEWVFRIMQEPKRLWKRYVIGNPVFLYRVMKWKFSRYRSEH
jgi:N-acetylglucosaminyldiphosphoundecaprenol N-acetyl-beta-D-mannosaminyltransferase